ncbi:hypothetical protein H4S07_002936 [Coemansia furcata]|uniref:Uncharacterized protein n=1 Tax=Coemansia furcata TaxID=417177 RepID=A0ACC1LK72_9FUNG|nr:hypothetical protein H4S07_002936 [Coemansia furcata]
MYSYITLAVFALASLVAAAPLPRPEGTLGGVVDALAPVTKGVGETVNNLAGFTDSSSGGKGGNSSGGGQGGNSSGGGQGGNSSGGGNAAQAGSGGSSTGVLGGVVDAVAPVTKGLGETVNNLAGFK